MPADLTTGRSRNCGCVRRDTVATRNYIHGKSNTREHVVWLGMIARCTNPGNSHYRYYGERGITVCERWMKSFVDFIADMGMPPSGKHSIDRIDNNGNYEPANCRWATASQQQQNKPSARRLTLAGVTRSMKEWSELLGIRYDTIKGRKNRGWTDEKALDTHIRTPSESASQGAAKVRVLANSA